MDTSIAAESVRKQPMDNLVAEIAEKTELLDTAVEKLKRRGKAFAKAESIYRAELAKAILEERANGTPVTIISDICRGKPEIARLRLDRDCKEVLYKSAAEAINNYKLQIRILDAQIEREWHSGQ